METKQRRVILETEKVVYDGKKFIELKNAKNVIMKDKLPVEYIKSPPHFYLGITLLGCYPIITSDEFEIFDFDKLKFKKTHIFDFRRDKVLFEPEEFERFLGFLKRCGERLHKIKKRYRELKREWNSKQTYYI